MAVEGKVAVAAEGVGGAFGYLGGLAEGAAALAPAAGKVAGTLAGAAGGKPVGQTSQKAPDPLGEPVLKKTPPAVGRTSTKKKTPQTRWANQYLKIKNRTQHPYVGRTSQKQATHHNKTCC